MLNTHKSRRIVILHCLGVSKCLQNWISLKQLIFQFSLNSVTLRHHGCKNFKENWQWNVFWI